MKYESSRLRALATSSQRLNKMLLLLTSLALLLVSMSYWAVGRVFEEESDKVDFHFARLIESIHEHESFLKQAAQGYSRAHQNVVTYVQPFSSKLIMLGDDEEVYQVKGLAMSIPFTLAKRNEYSDDAMSGALSWGCNSLTSTVHSGRAHFTHRRSCSCSLLRHNSMSPFPAWAVHAANSCWRKVIFSR